MISVLHNVRDCLTSSSFQARYLHLPTNLTPLPERVWKDSRFYPWFACVLGAVDCTHIDTITSLLEQSAHRNRKGRVSQNIFAACTLDMVFCFVLSGWEGSAADGHIFEAARREDFRVPDGFYYLADAGFPSCSTLLTPYRGVRYHLREWQQSGWQEYVAYIPQRCSTSDPLITLLRPETPQELFNLRHSQLRNVIERIFGVAKKQFLPLKFGTNFAPNEQASFVLALCILFNIICIISPPDELANWDNFDGNLDSVLGGGEDGDEGDLGGFVSTAERREADARRDQIAQEMWAQYLVARERSAQDAITRILS
jgi:hypothetical protein